MRTAVRPFFLTFLLLFFSIPATWADTLSGRVVDPDGRVVRGATVIVIDSGSVVATTVTDAAGRFTIETSHTGPFDVRASAEGFRARPVAVDKAGDVGTIALEVSAVREAVVVSASQVDIPLSAASSSVTVVTREDLLALQMQNLTDALRLAPGLAIASAGGVGAQTSVFPRGGESDYSLVFIDGVQANAFGGGFDFAHVPVVNVERIEIVRGPQSALYGSNAIGSVIRIVSRQSGAPVASGVFEGGSFATARVAGAASGSVKDWQWGASAERLASDGVVENDDYQRWTAAGSVGWSRSGGGVRTTLHYTNDERGFPGPFGSDPGGTFSGIDLVSRGSNDRWLASMSGWTPLGSRVRLTAWLSTSHIDGEVVSPFGGSETTSRRTTGRTQVDLTLQRDLQLSFGGEMSRERAGSTFIVGGGSRRVPVDRSLQGLFGEVRWSRADRLFVTGGVRAERIARQALAGNPDAFALRPDFAADTVTSANPKIGAAWFVRESNGTFTKLRVSAGTGIRPPDAFEIAFTDNPSLRPERSRSFETGIDQALAGGRVSLEATAFFNHYDDLIVAVGSFSRSSHYRTDNISNAQTRGVELTGNARARVTLGLPVDLDFRGSVTFLGTEILPVDGDSAAPSPFEPGDRLLRRPARQVSTELRVNVGRLSGFVIAGGRSRTRDVDPSFGTFGGLFDSAGYAVVHTGVNWRAPRGIDVFARVTNLFDRHYEEVLGFPALGRGVMAGIRVAAGR
ncbi:MAG: TonB-dependent receptor [Vicinamibacterales bacterium]